MNFLHFYLIKNVIIMNKIENRYMTVKAIFVIPSIIQKLQPFFAAILFSNLPTLILKKETFFIKLMKTFYVVLVLHAFLLSLSRDVRVC